MVTEVAAITVAPENAETFERVMREEGGLAALAASPGVISARFGRGIENPDRFGFVVEWESIAAHAAAKDSESFLRFRAAIAPYGIGGEMQHYDLR